MNIAECPYDREWGSVCRSVSGVGAWDGLFTFMVGVMMQNDEMNTDEFYKFTKGVFVWFNN